MNEAREIIRQAMAEWEAPGLSVAVASPSGLLWSEGFGLADVENSVPATPRSVYRFASISKPITAVAVMQLAERGPLDLDAPIQEYVPTFPRKALPITPRLILSHLSGIRDFNEDEVCNHTYYPYDSTPLLRHLARFQNDPLLHEPGAKFRYSSHGYVLLGGIIEAASGEGYLGYVRENIFIPAQMEGARPDDAHAIIPHRVRGYRRDTGDESGVLRPALYADTSDHLPAGGFCGTVEDAARFGVAVLDGKLVRPETLTQMLTRRRTRDRRDTRFGLGWFVWRRNGKLEAAHGGKHHGASTMLTLNVSTGIVVALMTNLQGVSSPGMVALTQKIADIFHFALDRNEKA